ncbi:hypothetical protein ACIQUY_32745 [Streptomyces sp. NPDC090231]|uniref:hypothetical protein n=1 Tax=unclassified Streptomyces TaxID=2593676 RepID=UPI0037F23B13
MTQHTPIRRAADHRPAPLDLFCCAVREELTEAIPPDYTELIGAARIISTRAVAA